MYFGVLSAEISERF